MRLILSTLAAAATIVVARPALAQDPAAPSGPACEIDQGKPQAIARAMLSLTRANAAIQAGGDASKDLKDIITPLTAANFRNDNPLGRAFMLASAYVLLLEQPNIHAVMPRGSVGISVNPTATIDLYAAADSAITMVENNSPACKEYMAPFRQQKAWINVTNAAINALNANELDSAEVFARRSLTMDRSSPYPYVVLSGVARARKDTARMVENAKKVVELAGADSTYADVKERALYEIAQAATQRAQASSGAARTAAAREAIAGWNQLVTSKDYLQGMNAVMSLQRMYIAAGDSASMGNIYAPMIGDPSRYSEGALLQAGVIASQLKRPDDAAELFAAVAARNPYSRDALNNLAASYLQADETAKVMPVIDKLVALDPSNPDNWLLYAFTYINKLKTTKDTRLTKAYNDSLVFFNNKAEKMQVRVAFTEFSRNSEGTTLIGTVENRGTAAKTYTLEFEFLGPRGEVLFTETASVGPVAPKATKEFRVHNANAAVAGYRYKPIS